jgi:hypothetical protein
MTHAVLKSPIPIGGRFLTGPEICALDAAAGKRTTRIFGSPLYVDGHGMTYALLDREGMYEPTDLRVKEG